MLSDNQVEIISHRVNAETDLPFLQESTEHQLIQRLLSRLNPHIEPALRAICPAPYIDCLKLALMEGVPIEEKRARIATILRGELEEGFARELSGSVDVSLVPERMEEEVMKVVAKKTIEEIVEWVVGEVDERMSGRLQETRELAQGG
eukprot:GFKZ01010577.1.p1 GENE.GFKZ01010577.1~~GFKZ01010577.1.p1  ORF type:complete len:148 (+),score=30.22 GFKZ01010577.1:169-612(+)